MSFRLKASFKNNRTVFKAALLASTMMFTAQTASASIAQEQLSSCLVKATTAADKTSVLQWTFAALATHPDLKAFAQVSEAQKEQLDKNFAAVVQRILVEQCSTQAKAVIQADGVEGIGASFQELGQITGEEILKNPEIKSQLKGVLKYLDLNKLVMTFLTPDIWNKLGAIR
ncbi:hypothetical protein A3K93_03010 [Acinetobacter sp. NCu2D-2]|uniref:hypothetical protein n=1 Tax=Acinetobacter sp. NCu2D-2 TaxID=1608473 RepID=UPI0007CDEB3A|nr:hypothetical protein [Acinetobacter sp. NCu2D-2]ANF81266.1 hypothetical protein A3K93_03010 [Acinetobacter sp. NCu2D-2]